MDAADTPTGPTLFNVIAQSDDPQAWQRFALRYGPLIHAWCRGWQLQAADAQDVLQEVLVRLYRRLASFQRQRDGSFRAYLKKITHSVLCDQDEANRRPGRGSGDSEAQRFLDNVAATDELAERLDREFDREVLEAATARVQRRVEPHTWEAFRLAALEGLAGEAVAERLGMKRAAVYVARGRVTALLREEIDKLEQSGPTGENEP
jgi:RNA polymerase sigma-70 factor (ECF subfamily)